MSNVIQWRRDDLINLNINFCKTDLAKKMRCRMSKSANEQNLHYYATTYLHYPETIRVFHYITRIMLLRRYIG